MSIVTARPLVNTSTSELSYLVGTEAIERLPLNGRNYTDLALLQPGVNAFPHRDGGSVVAHGLGMSVNGQDPRSNVYLLDGTLQNDFTNGPAGSAAGTALGMDTIREFRVEANAYSAEFGRNSGGQINVLTKSGANTSSGSAFEYHRNDALDSSNFFDAGEKPDFRRNQFGATLGGPIAKDRAFFFVGYEGLVERLGRTVSHRRARRQRAPRDPAAAAVAINPAVAPYLAEFPRANGPLLGQGLATLHVPVQPDGSTSISRRGAWTTTSAPTTSSSPATRSTTRISFCRPTTRSFRGRFFRAISSSPANTAGSSRPGRSTRRAIGFSRTRIGQNVQANTTRRSRRSSPRAI